MRYRKERYIFYVMDTLYLKIEQALQNMMQFADL